MHRRFPVILGLGASVALVAVVYFVFPASAVVFTKRGELPAHWPEPIRVLEKHSLTVEVAHGIQENAYEIRLKDRDAFEAAWPHILALKDKGAPITLESGASRYSRSGTTLEGPGVRVLTSVGAGGRVRMKTGSWANVGPPWPEYMKTEGVLPEYVTLTDKLFGDGPQLDPPQWITWRPDDPDRGFAYRARTEIMLVVDGNIVDLNRIKLPPDTPIIDNREFGDE